MTLSPLIPITTILYAAGILGGLAVVAYILKMRRRRFEVPFSMLWQRVLREKETTSLWRHLRRILSLLLQLLILALLLLAALDPQLGQADDDAKNIVIVIDTSASMKTIDETAPGKDGKVSRLEAAKAKVLELLAGIGGGDSVMLMRMDGQTTPLTRFESDAPRLRRVVYGLEASDTPADLRRALSAAGDALRDRKNKMLILVGDGAYRDDVLGDVQLEAVAPVPAAPVAPPSPDGASDGVDAAMMAKDLAAIDLAEVDLRYIGVGTAGDNVGIVAFNVRRYLANKTAYEVFIEVQNFGQKPARRKLKLFSGDLAIDVKDFTLQPGERRREIYPDLGGGDDHRLRASLEVPAGEDGMGPDGHDLFPLDDEAFALLPRRTRQRVLLVTANNLYLEGAMLIYDNIVVDKLTPEDYEASLGTLPDYDAVVFDDYTPEKLPPAETHLLYFNPSGEHSPFPIRRKLQYPRVTEVVESHPVMRWIVMSDVNFDATSIFTIDRAAGEAPLLISVRDVMGAAKKDGPRKIAAFGFSLGGTDLMMRVAFPLLLVNALDWFAGDDSDLITTYKTGERFWVPMDGTYGVSEVQVSGPAGKPTRAPLVDGIATFYGHAVGVHRLEAREGSDVVAQIELAANLSNPAESNVTPADELYVGQDSETPLQAPEGFTVSHRRSIWLYLVFLVLALLGVEWLTYNRRVTV